MKKGSRPAGDEGGGWRRVWTGDGLLEGLIASERLAQIVVAIPPYCVTAVLARMAGYTFEEAAEILSELERRPKDRPLRRQTVERRIRRARLQILKVMPELQEEVDARLGAFGQRNRCAGCGAKLHPFRMKQEIAYCHDCLLSGGGGPGTGAP